MLWVPDAEVDWGVKIEVPRERIGFWDRLAPNASFYSQALIYERWDNAGQAYYMVRMAVVQRNSAPDDPQPVSGFDDIAWDAFNAKLKTADPGSPETQEYLAGLDQEATQESARKSAKESEEKAHQAYLSSPQYKEDQMRQEAETCTKQVAWAKDAIARDDKIARISGYENKLVREQAAAVLVDCHDIIGRSRQASIKK
ncbi:hypothetical protein P0D88_16750 [Paraburkholderia sp. RL18-103-BIB-C]|uniref:hypothetical protein n=1 Tax=Paraburkholderia sp. RL18-103-BIB-C TaxID=3031637 RepID=UPI0038BB94AE